MANILLTGGSGFVGTAVREAAARRGIAIDAPPRAELDVLRPESLAPALEGVDVVVHAAGAAHVFRQTPDTARWTATTNAVGTRNVVAAARAAGVRRVVLVSSVAVHRAPHDVYASSKAAAERAAAEEAGDAVRLTMLRLATLYGEGDPGNVCRLIRAIDRHRFAAVGRGENRKSLIHRDDAGAAIVAALGVDAEGVFDVSAPAVTMAEVLSAIARALGRRVPRIPLSRRAALGAAHALTALTLRNRRVEGIERALSKWLADDVYDGAPFCARFGFTPAVALADGIAREVAWYRALRQRA